MKCQNWQTQRDRKSVTVKGEEREGRMGAPAEGHGVSLLGNEHALKLMTVAQC